MALDSDLERVGPSFNEGFFLKSRKNTIDAVKLIASQIKPGMNESDGNQVIDQTLQSLGCEKKWHPTKFRIGENTTKSFKEKSDLSIILKENDIFFIDIGPVFNGHEGDYGETFVIGSSEKYLKIKEASEEVFKVTSEKAQNDKLTGAALYEFAENYTNEIGYKFNNRMNGHRLGDFPHAIFSKSKLGEVDIIPQPNLWVLEILIAHPTENFGAFFEDLIRI